MYWNPVQRICVLVQSLAQWLHKQSFFSAPKIHHFLFLGSPSRAGLCLTLKDVCKIEYYYPDQHQQKQKFVSHRAQRTIAPSHMQSSAPHFTTNTGNQPPHHPLLSEWLILKSLRLKGHIWCHCAGRLQTKLHAVRSSSSDTSSARSNSLPNPLMEI